MCSTRTGACGRGLTCSASAASSPPSPAATRPPSALWARHAPTTAPHRNTPPRLDDREPDTVLVGLFACIYYGVFRPAEAAGLTDADLKLLEVSWGRYRWTRTRPSVGKQWTDSGASGAPRPADGRGSARTGTAPSSSPSSGSISTRSALPRTDDCYSSSREDCALTCCYNPGCYSPSLGSADRWDTLACDCPSHLCRSVGMLGQSDSRTVCPAMPWALRGTLGSG